MVKSNKHPCDPRKGPCAQEGKVLGLDLVNYGYQITGVLESPPGNITGFRVLVCTLHHFETVDVPARIFDNETLKYVKFRTDLPFKLDIRKLPVEIENKIRFPMNAYLDKWVSANLS